MASKMEAGLVIRSFESRDETSVVRLWSAVFTDDPPWNEPSDVIRRKKGVQSDLFLVGELEGKIVGTVVAGFDGVRGWIHKLAVFPEFQRMGVASSLMHAAEAGLSALGCPKVNLQVRASNAAVVKFYEDAGYSIEERVSMGKRLQVHES